MPYEALIVLDDALESLRAALVDRRQERQLRRGAMSKDGAVSTNLDEYWNVTRVDYFPCMCMAEVRCKRFTTRAASMKRKRRADDQSVEAVEHLDRSQFQLKCVILVLAHHQVLQMEKVGRISEYLARVRESLTTHYNCAEGKCHDTCLVPIEICSVLHPNARRGAVAPFFSQCFEVSGDPVAFPCRMVKVFNGIPEVAAHMEHLASYFIQGNHTKHRVDEGPVKLSKQRKVEASDFNSLYKAMLCEISGVSERQAMNLACMFPTMSHLLESIRSGEFVARASTATAFGQRGAFGEALARNVEEALTHPFIPEPHHTELQRLYGICENDVFPPKSGGGHVRFRDFQARRGELHVDFDEETDDDEETVKDDVSVAPSQRSAAVSSVVVPTAAKKQRGKGATVNLSSRASTQDSAVLQVSAISDEIRREMDSSHQSLKNDLSELFGIF